MNLFIFVINELLLYIYIMSYQQKYLKYKNKYLNLKKHLGGTKEENNNYLLHGTNLFYIDDIRKNGLNGIYNQKIYDIIEKYWPTIRYLSKNHYVDMFLDRQRNVRHDNIILLSFTGSSSEAKEYSQGGRQFGEGPSHFLRTLKEYIKMKRENITEDIITDYDFLYNASQYPGIILAINKDDFPQTQHLHIEDLESEKSLDFPIPADKFYIRRNKNDYIPLLSPAGTDYIVKLKSDFLEEEIIKKRNLERIELLEGWKTKVNSGPILFNYKINKMNDSVSISAQYDINREEEYPHYLQLEINNYSNIYIDISITNILGTTNYITNKNSMQGVDLFMSNSELKDKFKSVIEGIMTFIPSERKEKIYEKVIEIFPYLV